MRIPSMNLLYALCLAIGLSFAAHSPAAAAAEKTPAGDEGIAAKYPGDKNITKNKNVIFASGFEKGFNGWTKFNQKVSVIEKAKGLANSGSACAKTTATRGKNTGGDIVFSLPKAVDKLHLRFYTKFHKDTVMPHHFVKIRAIPRGWWGNAGKRPPGDKAFWTGIEPTKNKTWLFYTYWYKMRSWNNPDGSPNNPPEGNGKSFYGNTYHPANQKPFKRNEWICIEAMLKANTPGKSDGEQAFWIDGKLIGHWRPGAPVGSFIRDKFVTSGNFNKNPKPFPGFEFRAKASVKINAIALQWFVSAGVAKKAKTDLNIVYFDDVVIAKKYIGPRFTKQK